MAYRAQSEDTTPEAERLQFAIYARMTPAKKVERVRALCRAANGLALEGLRRRHPQESETALRLRLAEMRLGSELARRIKPMTR
jgi:hypothetical protein